MQRNEFGGGDDRRVNCTWPGVADTTCGGQPRDYNRQLVFTRLPALLGARPPPRPPCKVASRSRRTFTGPSNDLGGAGQAGLGRSVRRRGAGCHRLPLFLRQRTRVRKRSVEGFIEFEFKLRTSRRSRRWRWKLMSPVDVYRSRVGASGGGLGLFAIWVEGSAS